MSATLPSWVQKVPDRYRSLVPPGTPVRYQGHAPSRVGDATTGASDQNPSNTSSGSSFPWGVLLGIVGGLAVGFFIGGNVGYSAHRRYGTD